MDRESDTEEPTGPMDRESETEEPTRPQEPEYANLKELLDGYAAQISFEHPAHRRQLQERLRRLRRLPTFSDDDELSGDCAGGPDSQAEDPTPPGTVTPTPSPEDEESENDVPSDDPNPPPSPPPDGPSEELVRMTADCRFMCDTCAVLGACLTCGRPLRWLR